MGACEQKGALVLFYIFKGSFVFVTSLHHSLGSPNPPLDCVIETVGLSF